MDGSCGGGEGGGACKAPHRPPPAYPPASCALCLPRRCLSAGCGELSDHTDCACNVHPVGGHLLCHDDVIGNRRVSYIVYLTDPELPWGAADGGALELYPQGEGEGAALPHEQTIAGNVAEILEVL